MRAVDLLLNLNAEFLGFSGVIKMTSYARLLAIALLLGLPSACSRVEKSYEIAVLLAESGRADFIGRPEKAVIERMSELRAKAILDSGGNLPAVSVRFYDTGGDPANAVALLNKLEASPNVIAVIGPSTSGESIPMAEQAERLNIPMLSLAASKKTVLDDSGRTRQWVFKFAQNDDLAARRLVSAIQTGGHRRVVVLVSDDGFGKSGRDEFLLAARGLFETSSIAFPSDLTSPVPYIAALPQSTTAVVIWGTAPGPALLVQAIRTARPTVAVFLSHGNASEAFIAATGPAADGAVVIGSKVLEPPTFEASDSPSGDVVHRYLELWRTLEIGGPPSHFGGHARDAYAFLMEILPANINAMSTREARAYIRDALEQHGVFYGVTGTFKFSPTDHAGLGPDAFGTYIVRNGRFVPLSSQ